MENSLRERKIISNHKVENETRKLNLVAPIHVNEIYLPLAKLYPRRTEKSIYWKSFWISSWNWMSFIAIDYRYHLMSFWLSCCAEHFSEGETNLAFGFCDLNVSDTWYFSAAVSVIDAKPLHRECCLSLAQPSNDLNERSHRVQSISPEIRLSKSYFSCSMLWYSFINRVEVGKATGKRWGEVNWKSRNFPRKSVTFERLLIDYATLLWCFDFQSTFPTRALLRLDIRNNPSPISAKQAISVWIIFKSPETFGGNNKL